MTRAPQFRMPFSVVAGQVQEVEQGSQEEIGDCIEAVLRTPEGSRIDAPEFGRPDLVFAQLGASTSAEPYLRAVEEWEPRAAAVVGTAEVEDAVERIVVKQEG